MDCIQFSEHLPGPSTKSRLCDKHRWKVLHQYCNCKHPWSFELWFERILYVASGVIWSVAQVSCFWVSLQHTQWVLGLSSDLQSSAGRLCAIQEVCKDIPTHPRILGAVNHIKERKQNHQRRKSCHHRQVGWQCLSSLPISVPPSFPLCLYLIHHFFLLPLTSPPYPSSITLSPPLVLSLHVVSLRLFISFTFLFPSFSPCLTFSFRSPASLFLFFCLWAVQIEREEHFRGGTIVHNKISIYGKISLSNFFLSLLLVFSFSWPPPPPLHLTSLPLV